MLDNANTAEPVDDTLAHMPLPEGLVLNIPHLVPVPLDDDDPAADRQWALRASYQHNVAAGRPPYAGVALRTRGELQWLLRERGWSGDVGAQNTVRADLRAVILDGADLREMSLVGANLDHASLRGVTLSGALLNDAVLEEAPCVFANLRRASLGAVQARLANFSGADLREASLSVANLTRANLSQTDLRGAILQSAHLQQATLSLAQLSGPNLRWAQAAGADFTGTQLDSHTILADLQLDTTTRLVEVGWNGAPLTQVAWETLPWLGDETQASTPWGETPPVVAPLLPFLPPPPDSRSNRRRKSHGARMQEYRRAERAYRALALALRQQGLNRPAITYSTCAERMERQALYHTIGHQWTRRQRRATVGAAARWLTACALYGFVWLSAHLGWLIIVYVTCLLSFACAYWGLGAQTHTGFTLLDAVVLSLTAFHGRGVSPTTGVSDAMRVLSGVEAVVGQLTEALFVAAFTRRILSA